MLVWGTRQGRGGPVHVARVPSLRLDVPEVAFTLSQWGPYEVTLWRCT